MFTLVCRVERKTRNSGAGITFVLKPVEYQFVGESGPQAPGLDLNRTYVTVCDEDAFRRIHRESDLNSMGLNNGNLGVTQIVMTEMGSMYFNVFLRDQNTSDWFVDLDTVLSSSNLLAHLTVAGSCFSGEAHHLTEWLSGARFAKDTYWDRAPDLSLVSVTR